MARSDVGIVGNIGEIDIGNGGTLAELRVPSFLVCMLVLLGDKVGDRQRSRLVKVDYDGVGEKDVRTRIIEAARTVLNVRSGANMA